jgi:hypothetical protein
MCVHMGECSYVYEYRYLYCISKKKDVRILRCGGYMKNSGGSDNNLVTDEVQINLDVLGALMLHRVSREINDTYVITVNNSSSMKRGVKFSSN